MQDLLAQLISFKTISSDSKYSGEIEKCILYLQQIFQEKNFEISVKEYSKNKILIAKYIFDPNLKTAIIYGHYDVQPADITEGWEADPFTLKELEDKFIARGVVDNKGQIATHIHTIFQLIEENNLGYNIIFIIEGGEEIGSPGMEEFLEKNKEELKADFVMISDGNIIGNNPVIETGFRGILNIEIKVKTSDKELHSGEFGGSAPNAIQELNSLLIKLVDNKKILIEKFYDEVDEISEEIEKHSEQFFNIEEYKKLTGTKAILGSKSLYSQTGLLPSFNIVGINGGYTGQGFKTAIPNTASAKVNIRLVANQKPEIILDKVTNFINKIKPEYCDVEIDGSAENSAMPVKLDINNQFIEKARNILEQIWEKEVIYHYVGGTLPIAYLIKTILEIPQLYIPLANQDCNMHAKNENFKKEHLSKALDFSYKFFSK